MSFRSPLMLSIFLYYYGRHSLSHAFLYSSLLFLLAFSFFFLNDTPTPEISPLPLHDALPILAGSDAEVAEAPLPSGPVLVARGGRSPDEGPSELEYGVIRAGDYLAYDVRYGSLNPADDAE